MPRLSSPRRVAVTGLGLVSPLGIGNRENWDALLAGRCGLGPITRFDASRFNSRIAGEVKGFDPSLYIEKKEIKKMDIFIHYAMGAAHLAMEDSGVSVTDENRERFAVVVGSGIGGLPDHRGNPPEVPRERRQPARHLAVLHHGPHRQRGRRQHLDQVRDEGAEPRDGHGLHDGRACDRRGVPHDPVRRGGRRDRGRDRVGDHAARGRRVRRDEGPLDPQRRSAARLPPLGPRPRRLRDLRGRRARRPRGDGVREEARSSDLLRARRLRNVGRRVPHRGAVRGRRRPLPRHAELSRRRGYRAREDRLHQRPRHLDAARRQGRDAGDQEGLRRAREEGRGLVDEVDDRPPPRRRGRPRDRHLRPGRAPRHPAADDQLRDIRIRSATSTTCRTRRARRRSNTCSRTPSGSAARTAASSSRGWTDAA